MALQRTFRRKKSLFAPFRSSRARYRRGARLMPQWAAPALLPIEDCDYSKIVIGRQPKDGSSPEASSLLGHPVIISIGSKRQSRHWESARAILPKTGQSLHGDRRRGESGQGQASPSQHKTSDSQTKPDLTKGGLHPDN
jgi:hypothetical protein